ncbi:MAG: DUF2807 domain-containing protein [Bacteroidota bacterium]
MKKSIYALLFFGLFFSVTLTAQKSKKEEIRAVDAFERVNIVGHADVYLYPSDKNEIKASGSNIDWTLFETKLEQDELHISYNFPRNGNTTNFNSEPKLVIELYYQDLEELVLEGKIWVETEALRKSRKMKIESYGMIKGDLAVRAEYLTIDIEGMTKLEISGKAENAKVAMYGMGGIDASRLMTKSAYAEAEGMGKIQVDAREELNGSFSGIGSINYSGNPERKKINKEGIVIVRRN